MNPSDKPHDPGKERADPARQPATAQRESPDTDMQPEDAGTAASGGRATPAQTAMKQTSKTRNETGSRR